MRLQTVLEVVGHVFDGITRTKLYTVTLVLMVHLKTVVKLFQTVFQLLVLPFSFVIEVLVSVDNEFTKISEVVS